MSILTRAFALAATLSTAAAQLPPPVAPPENPLTPEKAMLGKILFWDEQLSSDDSVACGTCHLPEFGGSDPRLAAGLNPGPDGLFGTDDDVRGSAGVVRQDAAGEFVPAGAFELGRQATRRTAPTTLGAAHHGLLFWDGRASSSFDDPETGAPLIASGGALESQAVAPILNPVEMAREGRTWQDVRQKLATAVPLRLATDLPADVAAALQQNPTYPLLFTAAFGDGAITAGRIAFALASYERTQQPDATPWDLYQAGQSGAMSGPEKQGWSLFQNEGLCTACHWTPLFSDGLFHNLGLRPNGEDVGRYAETGLLFDVGAFKTPTLRNAGLRPRLFHNGQSPALGDPAQSSDPASTLNVYLQGGGVDPSNLDPFLLPLGQLGVTAAQLQQMQDFVRGALTDRRAASALPPFDHPTLRSIAVPPPRRFGPALAGAREPDFVATLPTYPGNLDFRLGLAAGDGAGLALVTYGFASLEPNALVAGLPWSVAVFDYRLFALAGAPGEPGHATWRLPIPGDPGLATVPLYFQLFALDALAPGGVAASRGAEFVVQ